VVVMELAARMEDKLVMMVVLLLEILVVMVHLQRVEEVVDHHIPQVGVAMVVLE